MISSTSNNTVCSTWKWLQKIGRSRAPHTLSKSASRSFEYSENKIKEYTIDSDKPMLLSLWKDIKFKT